MIEANIKLGLSEPPEVGTDFKNESDTSFRPCPKMSDYDPDFKVDHYFINRLVPGGEQNHNRMVYIGMHHQTASFWIFAENSKKLGLQIFELYFWSEIKTKNFRQNHPVKNIWNFSDMIKYWKTTLFHFQVIKFFRCFESGNGG